MRLPCDIACTELDMGMHMDPHTQQVVGSRLEGEHGRPEVGDDSIDPG